MFCQSPSVNKSVPTKISERSTLTNKRKIVDWLPQGIGLLSNRTKEWIYRRKSIGLLCYLTRRLPQEDCPEGQEEMLISGEDEPKSCEKGEWQRLYNLWAKNFFYGSRGTDYKISDRHTARYSVLIFSSRSHLLSSLKHSSHHEDGMYSFFNLLDQFVIIL